MDDVFTPSRYCPHCQQTLPITQFYERQFRSQPGDKLHFQTYCVRCARDRAKRWNQANPERVKANRARYRASHVPDRQTINQKARDARAQRSEDQISRDRVKEQAAYQRYASNPDRVARRNARVRQRVQAQKDHVARLEQALHRLGVTIDSP